MTELHTPRLSGAAPTTATPDVPAAPRGPGDGRPWRYTGRRLRSTAKHLGLIVLTLLMLYPVLWMVVSSLRPNNEIFRRPGLILDSLQTSNYTDGWHALADPFGHYMLNSALVVL